MLTKMIRKQTRYEFLEGVARTLQEKISYYEEEFKRYQKLHEENTEDTEAEDTYYSEQATIYLEKCSELLVLQKELEKL